MCIRICDILELNILKKNRLLAGVGGLGNIVTGINIYEYMLKKTHDRTGELYLTSFYNIREGGEEALLEHIRVLIDTNCPGLLMGAGTYADVNEEIKKLADEHNFPIISIEENIIYSDVLESVYKLILESTAVDTKVILLDRIMALEEGDIISKYVSQINAQLDTRYCTLHFSCDKNKDMAYILLNNELGYLDENTIIKYENEMVIIVSSRKELGVLDGIMTKIADKLSEINTESYFGISNVYEDYRQFKKAITESKYAHMTCSKITKKRRASISQIGIYRMLIPICKNEDVVEYARSVVNKVRAYDESYNMEILETVLMYLKCDYDILETSKRLFLHKNTIRYRLKKIESIIDNANGDCMEQLSIAIRILKLINEI